MDEEDLKNMTPEQIAQMQKQNCIFCKIIAGEIPSKKIYEDAHFIGILDINPATDGHVLLLPKQHVQIMPQMTAANIGGLGTACQHVSEKMINAFSCDGVSVFMANGVVAGQRAPHFMVHIIPRKEGDGINLNPELAELDDTTFNSTKQKILSSLGVKQQTGAAAGAGVKQSAANSARNSEQSTAHSPASKKGDDKKRKKEYDAEFVDVDEESDEEQNSDGQDSEREAELKQARDGDGSQKITDEIKDEDPDDEEKDEESSGIDSQDEDDAGSGKIDFDKLSRLFR